MNCQDDFGVVLFPFSLTSGKKVLIVYAHQEPKSLNGSLKTIAVEELSKQGCSVTVSDLYAMQFEPRTTRKDIIGGYGVHFKDASPLAFTESIMGPVLCVCAFLKKSVGVPISALEMTSLHPQPQCGKNGASTPYRCIPLHTHAHTQHCTRRFEV